MKFIFCDDDPRIITELHQYVTEFFALYKTPVPEISSYSSGNELLSAEDYGDIVFLDVEMPGQSGISVGKQIMQKNPRTKVIILTNYPDYLDAAMEFRVFRYLSKPIDKDRLFRNIKLAIKQHMEETSTVDIRTKDGVVSCSTEEIICVKYYNRKAIIYTTTEEIESVHAFDSLKGIFTAPCFFQSHRSYIINMKYIRKIDKLNVTLNYRDRTFIAYLTARKHTDMINAYLQYRGRDI